MTAVREASPRPAPPRAAEPALRRALVDAASARYRPAGRFAYHFARGKLGLDPLFTDLLRLGALPARGRFLDLGCGQGVFAAWLLAARARFLDLGCGQAVFAAWLLAARARFDAGQWPAGWPAPPLLEQLHGLELMPRDVARAQAAFVAEPRVQVAQGDICATPFEPVDAITILDVLHYFDAARQHDVLRRARAAFGPGGVLVARVGDAARGLRFDLSRWVDQAVTLVRGHGFSSLHCRSAADWAAALAALGFDVRIVPTEGGPPFANTLLIARVPAAGEGHAS